MKKFYDVEEKVPLLQGIPLSLQHLFAMFGSTVLIPFLLHVNPATALFMNGIGTILYLIICKIICFEFSILFIMKRKSRL